VIAGLDNSCLFEMSILAFVDEHCSEEEFENKSQALFISND
jgi:hypothetical protein